MQLKKWNYVIEEIPLYVQIMPVLMKMSDSDIITDTGILADLTGKNDEYERSNEEGEANLEVSSIIPDEAAKAL